MFGIFVSKGGVAISRYGAKVREETDVVVRQTQQNKKASCWVVKLRDDVT